MNWLIPNLPRIATWIMIGIAIMAAMTAVALLPSLPEILARAEFTPWTLIAGLAVMVVPAVYVLGALLVYGVVLRFLALCDDVAAIRHACVKNAAQPD